MAYKSKKQQAWAHSKEGLKALGGADKVAEWDKETDFAKLPKKKKPEPAEPETKASVKRIRHTTRQR